MPKTYKPKVFAHRGSNTLAPENSQPAFDLALTEGADGFETDVQLSRDFVPLLWHDDDLQRIGVPLKKIVDYSLEELELLDISLLCADFQGPCRLLTLRDFLRDYFKRTPLLLELKDFGSDGRESEEKIKCILEVLKRLSIDPQSVMISSFQLNLLEKVHELTDKSFLVANIADEDLAENLLGLVKRVPYLKGVCLEKDLVYKKNIQQAKALNLKTLVYTCNSRAEVKRVFESKVDIIISDVPGDCQKMIKDLPGNQ